MKIVRKPKNKILVSFSGGETSAYMLQHILANYKEHEIKVVFANTGEENEETLEFIEKCSNYFNIEVIWLEYSRSNFIRVNFETAYRSHNEDEIKSKWQKHPFRKYIKDFGIPNKQNMTCTRELKQYVIDRYMSSVGWKPKDYTKAIGIRVDEIDRVGKLWYPLALSGINKQMINHYWDNMPFRLGLKGYEGNCKTCWKKSFRKLVTIARYNPERFDFFKQMEAEFYNFKRSTYRDELQPPYRFFRERKTVNDIFKMAEDKSIIDAEDDSINTNYQTNLWHDGTELDSSYGCSESCEVFN